MADAYASLGLLKHVPCPAGDRCTAFKCLFRHTWDEAAWPLPKEDNAEAGSAHSGQSKGATIGSENAQEPPAKRMKVTEADGNGTPSNKTSDEDGKTSDSQRGRIQKDALYDPLSAPISVPPTRQSVSPPPLKRKTPALSFSSPNPSPPQVAAGPNPASNTIKIIPPKKPSSDLKATPESSQLKAELKKASALAPAPAPAPAPRKPESLNPRLLKKPPAGHETRFKLLKLLHAEYARLNSELKKDANDEEAKLVLSDQALIWMALDEEQKIATEKPSIYSNVIKNRIMSFKRMSTGQWTGERREASRATTKSGPQKKGASGAPIIINTGLTPEQEVKLLPRILTPIDKLSEFGYVPKGPSAEDIQSAKAAIEMSKGWEKCVRCTTRFQVFPGRREEDGKLASGGPCVHHPGKTYWAERLPGDFTKQIERFSCCSQAKGDSIGCATGEYHVFKAVGVKSLATVLDFAETPPNPHAPKDRAVCFDCEMCYTVNGFELVRLTATSWPGGEELLDVLVEPIGQILDLNSQFSGVYSGDIANAFQWTPDPKTWPAQTAGQRKRLPIVSSPVVARDLLFSLISPDTPLIGHGLENDLNAVRVIHPTLIDTIILYPHRFGLPKRLSLKGLTATHLNRQIQMEPAPGQLAGHDSGEDARAAGELVRLRVSKEWNSMQSHGWTTVDGELIPPGGKPKD